MAYKTVFERCEIKFILTTAQETALKEYMKEYMSLDEYGKSTVCNIYLDTPDFLLIRRSIDKPTYKEKVRIRSYGVIKENQSVFFEIKKKYNGVVYKRRLNLTEKEVMLSVENKTFLSDTQIGKEMDYALKFYKDLQPKMFLSYEREAYYLNTDNSFRITFDKNILWRDYDLNLHTGIYGNKVLDSDKVLMEIKTGASIPLWLCKFLSKNKIYKTSFSKYGTAYQIKINQQEKLEETASA